MDISNKNIALLIDAENISTKYLQLIIDEANKYGTINYKRAYGDWSSSQLSSWKSEFSKFGLTPVQQFSYTSGKNSSDFSLVIDAMDILYKGKVDSFCIVTSDSDFTKLVTRLKEDNMFVFGLGESKTPLSLVNSCESFSYLDKMLQIKEKESKKVVVEKKQEEKQTKPIINNESSITPIEEIFDDLKKIINDNLDDDGWAYWGNVAQLFQKKYPGFHPRNYGDNIKPLTFFEKYKKDFEFEKRKSSIFVKCI